MVVRTLAEQAGESDPNTPPPPPSYLVSFEPTSQGLYDQRIPYARLGSTLANPSLLCNRNMILLGPNTFVTLDLIFSLLNKSICANYLEARSMWLLIQSATSDGS